MSGIEIAIKDSHVQADGMYAVLLIAVVGMLGALYINRRFPGIRAGAIGAVKKLYRRRK